MERTKGVLLLPLYMCRSAALPAGSSFKGAQEVTESSKAPQNSMKVNEHQLV